MNEEKFKESVHMSNYMWRNRRRMAWMAFYSMIIVTALSLFYIDIARLEKLSDVITWFYMTMASVVGAYMGLSTYASVRGSDPSYDRPISVEEVEAAEEVEYDENMRPKRRNRYNPAE